MGRKVWLVLAGVLALISPAAMAQDAAAPFKSEAGRFSVLFPDKPMEQKQTSDTSGGKIDIFLFLVVKPTTVYLVGYGDYPEATLKQSSPAAMLEADRDGFVKAVSGKVTSEKKITFEGNPGLEFTVESPNQTYFLVREYMVKNRLYQVVTRGSDPKKPELKKFQDSFKLLK